MASNHIWTDASCFWGHSGGPGCLLTSDIAVGIVCGGATKSRHPAMKTALAEMALPVLKDKYNEHIAILISDAYTNHIERDQRDFAALIPVSVIHDFLMEAGYMEPRSPLGTSFSPGFDIVPGPSKPFMFDSVGRLNADKKFVPPQPQNFRTYEASIKEMGNAIVLPAELGSFPVFSNNQGT
jgi:hypothetical protein